MANRIFVFGLLVLILFVHVIECKGGGRGGGGRGGGRGSGGRSWGGSHSSHGSSHSKSSSSWWSGWWGSSSGSSASSSGHSYPSSSTGLSGSSHGSSSSSSSHSYPSSSSGLSGSGSGKSSYPYSSTGLSGRNHHTATGQSDNRYYTPTYYSAPQHVYVTEYRNSGSSYGDLLTGLTLYNLGRSHSHYHENYYNDDFYNRRYSSSNSNNNNYNTYSKPQETAICRLKIKDRDSVETLKIPCEIVSTFTEDSKKVSKENTITTNTTVCVSKNMVVNSTFPSSNVMVGPNTTLSADGSNKVINNTLSPEVTVLVPLIKNNITNSTSFANNTESMTNITSASENIVHTSLNSSNMPDNSRILTNKDPVTNKDSVLNTTINKTQEVLQKPTVVYVTTCTTTVNTTDPLTVKGRPVDPSGKECIVEIQTRESLLSNKIDCSTLMKYAKMPEPRKEGSSLMPSRDKLKSWLSNPPWWMSAFIAV